MDKKYFLKKWKNLLTKCLPDDIIQKLSQTTETTTKKDLKNLKKVVDKWSAKWYDVKVAARAEHKKEPW